MTITFNLLLKTDSLLGHECLYIDNHSDYLVAVERMMTSSAYKNVPFRIKVFMVTVLLQHLCYDALRRLYTHIELPEMLRACELLDGRRYIKQLKTKMARHNNLRMHKKTTILNKIEDLESNLQELTYSLTSSKARLVKKWFRQIPASKLEDIAVMFSLDGWKQLIDWIHPSSRDFALPWFMNYCFGAPPPEDSMVAKFNRLTAQNFKEVYQGDIPYKLIRLKLKCLNDLNRLAIAEHEPVHVILWYFKELYSPTVAELLANRLEIINNKKQDIELSYGTLVDLLSACSRTYLCCHDLYGQLVRLATRKLAKYNNLYLGRVLVMGDASASMEIAIKTSSIITSLLCAVARADMCLFRNKIEIVDSPPKKVEEALDVAQNMKAHSSTSPAHAMDYYLQRKQFYNTIIIVTDEEENTDRNGKCSWLFGKCSGSDWFAHLYKQYIETVHQAKLIFVSFTNPTSDGKMVCQLKAVLGDQFDELVSVYKYDIQNPDLNKLDYLLNKLEQMGHEIPRKQRRNQKRKQRKRKIGA